MSEKVTNLIEEVKALTVLELSLIHICLHVHNTTIYRELKRGRYTHLNSDLTTEERYSPEIAQQRYEENLKAKGGELKIGNDYELSAFIEKKIGEEGYSPAAVVGEIKRLGLTSCV